MATDAGAFIDALRALHFTDSDWLTGHVDVLGFSLGGFVAPQLALNRPDVVERVVLAATAPQGGEGLGAPLPEVTKSLLADPQTPDDVLFLLFARSGTSRAAGQAFLARLGGRQQDSDAPLSASAAAAQMRAMKGWGSAPAAGGPSYLSSIKQLVLVADGEADVVMRTNNSRFLAPNLPSARLVVYPDSAQGFLFQTPTPSRRTLPHSYDDLEPATMIPPEPTEILDAEARLLTCLDRLAEVLALAKDAHPFPWLICGRPFAKARLSPRPRDTCTPQ